MGSTNIKNLNKRKVLHYIQQDQGQSRANIAKILNISKPTISNIVDELLSEGWIREKESTQVNSSGGRRPYQLFFNQDAYHLVGVDIGGTSVEVAIMNLDGEIQNHTSFDTQTHVGNSLVPTIAETIKKLIQKNNLKDSQIFGVGVGVPGITDVKKGVVIDAPSVEWKNMPLQSELEKLLPFPVYLENDVNAAALGELWKGAGKTSKNFSILTLGTAIGCGLVINGQLYRGFSYAAGEIGYMVTDKNAAEEEYEHTFVGYGFLDSHVGGPSITRNIMKILGEEKQSDNKWSAKNVFQAAIDGDQKALAAIDPYLSHLAFALVNVISIINPERIVLGGGIANSIHHFLPNISATIEKHIPVQTEIEITSLKNVSLLGAGYLLLKEHDSILKI